MKIVKKNIGLNKVEIYMSLVYKLYVMKKNILFKNGL